MEESLETLNIEIKILNKKLEDEIKNNNEKEETLYNITKQLHQIQEYYLDIDEELKILKLKNRSLLKEIDYVLKNKIDLETLCKEQSIEIERAITLINNYLKIK